MMIEPEYDHYETISDIHYRNIVQKDERGQPIGGQDVLYVGFESGESIHINNTDFTLQNWALMFMAAVGVRPGNMESAVGNTVPVSEVDDGVFPPDWVFDQGQQMLQRSEWGPDQ